MDHTKLPGTSSIHPGFPRGRKGQLLQLLPVVFQEPRVNTGTPTRDAGPPSWAIPVPGSGCGLVTNLVAGFGSPHWWREELTDGGRRKLPQLHEVRAGALGSMAIGANSNPAPTAPSAPVTSQAHSQGRLGEMREEGRRMLEFLVPLTPAKRNSWAGRPVALSRGNCYILCARHLARANMTLNA